LIVSPEFFLVNERFTPPSDVPTVNHY
jgi:hypothetical protein